MQSLRLAELLAGLSLVADAGMGLEPGEASRAALVAMELTDDADAYYTTLLQHIGCTAYAFEAARALGGDEIAVKRAALFGTGPELPRVVVEGYSRANCEVAARTAERVGLGAGVVAGLLDVYERWDGEGGPRRVAGEAIAEPARIAQAAATAALFHRSGAATEALRERAGTALDPRLAAWAERAVRVLDRVEDPIAAAVAAEPQPHVTFTHDPGLDRVCRAVGEVVDIKTPLHHGHCTGVAALAAGAAAALGLDAGELRRAGFVHDLGRASVPNGVWEHPGPLTWSGQERVRLHAYHSERVLARCGALAPLARLAGAHHERLDGTGYHRGLAASGLSGRQRVLAAADVMRALTEPRAHRPARTIEEAAAVLAEEVAAGRLDPDAARAVAEAAGATARPLRVPRPAGLTERQVQVLRLVARGRSNPEIALELVISRRTAERHVQDVYVRIGVASRAAAALFAVEHDLFG